VSLKANLKIQIKREVFYQFTIYEGLVQNPFYPEKTDRYHKAKHETQPRWIWYSEDDLTVRFEQFDDDVNGGYIKEYINGGIIENNDLKVEDFKVKACKSPLVSLASRLTSRRKENGLENRKDQAKFAKFGESYI
jgi:hypothetical protein